MNVRKLQSVHSDASRKPAVFAGGAGMRRVAVLIETSGSVGRGLLRGVAKYNRTQGGWSTYFQPHGLGDPPPAWLDGWKGDGILARVRTREVADRLLQTGLPVVTLCKVLPGLPFPSVGSDTAEIGKMAAAYLIERGLKNFGFHDAPLGSNLTTGERGENFQNGVNAAGWVCHVFPTGKSDVLPGWEAEQERLARWIDGLPKPVGIMAHNDEGGLQVLDACRRCGAAVPDEVAVIGVDDDEHLCDLAIPSLTSIDVNAEKIGQTAAALLDQMMQGGEAFPKSQRLPPRGVVSRLSTDTVASADEEVGRAIRYIREYGCNGLRVPAVLAHLGVSRASLQHRMKKITGRTIHQEIEHTRLSRVKEILLSPDMTIKQAARAAGFSSVQYMTRVFRITTGETPAKYRANYAR